MTENIIVQSKCGKSAKEAFRVSLISTLIIGILFMLSMLFSTSNNSDNMVTDLAAAAPAAPINTQPFTFIPLLIIDIILFFLSRTTAEITVTDKRVYGIVGFSGKRVDLPLDSISSIKTSTLGGIAIATSSGFIKFRMLDERYKVYTAISKLLNERQESASTIAPMPSNADELQKYKNLLDNGTITQEEFDSKKKQLLGL